MRKVLIVALCAAAFPACKGGKNVDDDEVDDKPVAKKVAPAAPAAATPAAPAPSAPAAAPAPTAAAADEGAAADAYKSTAKVEWVKIPAGKFHFGCEPQDQECGANEKPGADVSNPAFQIMKTEVTVEQYKPCVDAKKCAVPQPGAGGVCEWGAREPEKIKNPINCVTFEEAAAYCKFIGARLPTAQEWEGACKSNTSRIYPWGDERPDDKRAKWGDGFSGPSAAGAHPTGATKFGLHDMAGNVWEWTTDVAGEGFTEVRGGAWRNQAYLLHCSHRGKRPATDRDDWIGFRCVK